jgi:hypothetical protein
VHAGEAELAQALVLAWRMVITTTAAILARMEHALVLVEALATGDFEASWASAACQRQRVAVFFFVRAACPGQIINAKWPWIHINGTKKI